ncbi:phosphoribosylformylglycinamidine synthase subunit PurS [Halalkalibacillus sediminis]|uniref:Phosphoribosylformylglycinamidine synthase subunit PurS n=1 Tax=Halalkalibacillus sediminis TaxID=2018042 RepID=A0A2I0QQG5_9BACI|nr:phosphoribosylformylglycinamidine synthase subunit PurS [Halalkalibacillus sediminis]PKR76559.1 phosphoribosylformylglycinamidine synthase subunit PurS [Halalkalibacillus sediminis]
MVKVKVYVTLKEGVLDPQGKAVERALHTMNYDDVQDMRVGKYMEFFVEPKENVTQEIEDMCERLLSNPVIEDYRYETEEVATS